MADITTAVLIIGTGPAGAASGALLSTYGIENMMINRYHWLANTPRAHITNQRTMEVLRDLGHDVEAEAYMHATEQDLMGENVFLRKPCRRRDWTHEQLGNTSVVQSRTLT
ncbi:FAD-dependent monooxygenase [Planktomarina sp.]|nr:FAD-dependent monooxygenase [Planktomarina sp.]